MERLCVWVTGSVQGVGFRWSTQSHAERLNLTGWVRNLHDGRVEVLAEGERNQLEELLLFLEHGPGFSRVTKLTSEWREATGEFKRFTINQSA